MEITAPHRSPRSVQGSVESTATAGLGHWMHRVLEECDRVNTEFCADAVHDLRVALRRCRTMADGLMVFDPSPSWKEMKRAGGRLFRGLGALRDAHVMSEWMSQLAPDDDSEAQVLLGLFAKEESRHKLLAAEALREFNTKQWRKWSRELPARAARLRMGSLVFQHLALERWTEAHNLHRQALRNRSQVAFHRLRVGIKRLRYIVENFLPKQHEAWSSDLKELQDLLGEVHDLDVLWATARRANAFGTLESRARWQMLVQTKRAQRIARYRERMVGPNSLWSNWRSDLPQGDQIQAAAILRLRLWASFLDPNVRHSQQVAALARKVLDGLASLKLVRTDDRANARVILEAAAFLHEVGLSKRTTGHHKIASRMIRKLILPLGWSQEDLLLLASVVRFHRGALPQPRCKFLRGLTPQRRQISRLLAGILRFAHAFADPRAQQVGGLKMENEGGVLLVSAAGYSPMTRAGQEVAKARHLLEIVLRKPILVKPMKEPFQ